MNLDDLKPAWAIAKFNTVLPAKSTEQILLLLDSVEQPTKSNAQHLLWHVGIFLLLMIGCQGG